MKFNITVDKKAQATIDGGLCINCGECRQMCPTGAIDEYQKTVTCSFAPRAFADAKRQATNLSCSTGCPLGIIPQAVTSLIQIGDLDQAYEHISERSPMPRVCATVCNQICRESCKRGCFVDEAINMGALESYVLSKSANKPLRYIKRYNEKVAIIGGGPAGLSAAYHLAKSGYAVTIFEKDGQPGGALHWGIPAFRLDKEVMQQEIDRIISAGIEVRYQHHIGENHPLDKLWEEGFAACLIAVGTSYGKVLQIPGSDGEPVYDGVRVMRQINGGMDEGVTLGQKILVVGGGALAADLSRMLRRMDRQVVCVAMDEEDTLQMPHRSADELGREGVELKCGMIPKQIITENGKVKAVELIRVDYTEDQRGRLRPNPVKGSEQNVFCDTVIFAASTRCRVEDIANVETYPDGKVKIDGKHRTNKKMIFACGDATGESDSVVEAMAAGRDAAEEIHNAIHGTRMDIQHGKIRNAADGQAIGADNIQPLRPQYERVLREGELAPSAGYTDDIMAVVRSAGIEENMPRFNDVYDTVEKAHKVAIIGGGIAGVTAAVSLVRKGYRPTIFEKYPALGGSYRWLSTDKRIDKKLLIRELDKVEAGGIETVYNVSAGIRPDIRQLFKMGFGAILFAIGESGGGKPKLKNVDCAGVFDMVSLMGRLADNEIIRGIGQRIMIVGSDEMTFDMARKLKEFCREVTILAPYSKGNLQINTSAAEIALEEGVNLVTGVKLSGINEKNGRVTGVDCRVVEKNFPVNIPCDTLVISSGTGPETDAIAIRNLELDMDEDGYITTDDNLATSIPGVFAIGDLAMSSTDAGRAGAIAIDNFLAGKNTFINVGKNHRKDRAVNHEMIEGSRQDGETGFAVGKAVLEAPQAAIEAARCLHCGYHREQPDLCMGCGICVKMCPVGAISLMPVDNEPVENGSVDKEEVETWRYLKEM